MCTARDVSKFQKLCAVATVKAILSVRKTGNAYSNLYIRSFGILERRRSVGVDGMPEFDTPPAPARWNMTLRKREHPGSTKSGAGYTGGYASSGALIQIPLATTVLLAGLLTTWIPVVFGKINNLGVWI